MIGNESQLKLQETMQKIVNESTEVWFALLFKINYLKSEAYLYSFSHNFDILGMVQDFLHHLS